MRVLFVATLTGVLAFNSAALAAPSRSSNQDSSDVNPDLSMSLYNQGLKLLLDKQFAEAQVYFERVLAEKQLPQAHNNLAYVLRKQGPDYFDKALIHYNQAIALDPKLPEPYMYRGVLHVQMQNLELAQQDLQMLQTMNSPLAAELEPVIKTGQEKDPEQFFGVSSKL